MNEARERRTNSIPIEFLEASELFELVGVGVGVGVGIETGVFIGVGIGVGKGGEFWRMASISSSVAPSARRSASFSLVKEKSTLRWRMSL